MFWFGFLGLSVSFGMYTVLKVMKWNCHNKLFLITENISSFFQLGNQWQICWLSCWKSSGVSNSSQLLIFGKHFSSSNQISSFSFNEPDTDRTAILWMLFKKSLVGGFLFPYLFPENDYQHRKFQYIKWKVVLHNLLSRPR